MSGFDGAAIRAVDLQEAFDSIRPILVLSCEPISQSCKDIQDRYNISVESAELELSFKFASSGTLYVAESKENASITIKLVLKPENFSGISEINAF